MSAWASLGSWIKRPAVWIGGVLAAAAGTYATTNLMTPVQTFLAEKTAEKACQYRQKPIANESQFTILVTPLAHDPDKLHTEKIMQALLSEEGFLAIPLCEPFNVDFLTDTQSARDDMRKRATALINEKKADLLLFGDVSEQGKAVLIYAVNEHGGCDLHPKPTEIKQGVLGSDFTAEEKEKLIEVSLQEIESACLNQSSIDWPLFGKRMTKMEQFLKYFDFSQAKALEFATSYVEATRLLYSNGQGESWFTKGENFAKKITGEFQGDKADLSSIWTEYGTLQFFRFEKTGDKNDQDIAFDAFNKAIGSAPNNAWAYSRRGLAYVVKGDFDRAIEDFTKAIGLDPKNARAYDDRRIAFLAKSDFDRAIEDSTKAIELGPKVAAAYTARGEAYGAKRDWDRAVADYDKAIELDPKLTLAYYNRGDAYFNKGDFDRAIADYDHAIGLDPKNASAYNNRGLAYANKGELDRAIEDYTKAIGLDPKLALAYAGRGDASKKKGDLDHAIEDYTKAIGLGPNPALYGARGYAYGETGDWDRAIEDYTKAIGFDPKEAFAYEARGDAYKKKGDLSRAIEDYTKAIGLYPKDKDYQRSIVYGDRASAYLAKGDKKRSFADFKKGMELGGAPQ
jgi:tetratricopeptide (TPR) repeat protein